jgi:hypothetical protein
MLRRSRVSSAQLSFVVSLTQEPSHDLLPLPALSLSAAAKVLLPAGLQYVGVCVCPAADAAAQADKVLRDATFASLLQHQSSANQGILVISGTNGSPELSISWQQQGTGSQPSQQQPVTLDPWPETDHGSTNSNSQTDSYAWANQLQLCLLRCHATVTLDVYVREPSKLTAAIQVATSQACEQWGASQEVSYIVSGSGPKAVGAQLVTTTTTTQQGATMQELATRLGATTPHPLPLAGPAPLQLLTWQPAASHPAADTAQGSRQASGPMFSYQPVSGTGPVTHHAASVALDVLVVAPLTAAVSAVSQSLILPALRAQLQAAGELMAAKGRVMDVTAYHFLPPGRAHHVTPLYPHLVADMEANEAQLAPYRRLLHALLGLPADRPALRVANALPAPASPVQLTATTGSQQQQAAAAPQSLRLRDVHNGLSPPGK